MISQLTRVNRSAYASVLSKGGTVVSQVSRPKDANSDVNLCVCRRSGIGASPQEQSKWESRFKAPTRRGNADARSSEPRELRV
jgi:hypothetical protein